MTELFLLKCILVSSLSLTTGTNQYGQPTFHRDWDDGSNSAENYKRRVRAAFEFFSKLGMFISFVFSECDGT
jgi:xylose isomerase